MLSSMIKSTNFVTPAEGEVVWETVLLEEQVAEVLRAMEVGVRQWDGVVAEEVRAGQQVATLVEVGAGHDAAETLYMVGKEDCGGHCQFHVPQTRSLPQVEGLPAQRCGAADGGHRGSGCRQTVVAVGPAGQQQLSGAVALQVVVVGLSGQLDERLAAGILPHTTAVGRCHSTHRIFSHAPA